jgi:hypothetical protein
MVHDQRWGTYYHIRDQLTIYSHSTLIWLLDEPFTINKEYYLWGVITANIVNQKSVESYAKVGIRVILPSGMPQVVTIVWMPTIVN